MYILISALAALSLQPGGWAIKSTVIELSLPGVPKFLQHMARGKSMSERKQLAAGQGIEALLAPDPKAQCRVDNQRVADGHYSQTLVCPQKGGEPVHIERAGTYDGTGFSGRATVVGATPKGPISIVLDQRAARTGG